MCILLKKQSVDRETLSENSDLLFYENQSFWLTVSQEATGWVLCPRSARAVAEPKEAGAHRESGSCDRRGV